MKSVLDNMQEAWDKFCEQANEFLENERNKANKAFNIIEDDDLEIRVITTKRTTTTLNGDVIEEDERDPEYAVYDKKSQECIEYFDELSDAERFIEEAFNEQD